MAQNDNQLSESDFLKMIWDYFSLHANQRIQMLNFYIVLESFFVTGLLTLFQINSEWIIFRPIISVAIIFFSFIFCALDERTKKMIKYSEDALKTIEQKYATQFGNEVMIFSVEQEKTLFERRMSRFAREFLSYSKLFRLIYFFFTIIGLSGIAIEFINRCS